MLGAKARSLLGRLFTGGLGYGSNAWSVGAIVSACADVLVCPNLNIRRMAQLELAL